MQNPPIKPITREQQLQLQNEMLTAQLQSLMNQRATGTKYMLGDVMDGIAFTLQTAEHGDEQASAGAKQDLQTLKMLLDKVLSGDWQLSSPGKKRLIVPK